MGGLFGVVGGWVFEVCLAGVSFVEACELFGCGCLFEGIGLSDGWGLFEIACSFCGGGLFEAFELRCGRGSRDGGCDFDCGGAFDSGDGSELGIEVCHFEIFAGGYGHDDGQGCGNEGEML